MGVPLISYSKGDEKSYITYLFLINLTITRCSIIIWMKGLVKDMLKINLWEIVL